MERVAPEPERDTSAPEGAALLVAAHGVIEAATATLHTLGQIGEALLETARGWQLRRLAATPGERETPSRASLKRYIVELADQDVPVAVLAIAGLVVDVEGEPALVTGPQYADFAGDSTLPLSWIRDKLRACRAESVVVVLSTARITGARKAADRAWLDALGTSRPGHVVAVDGSGPSASGLTAFLAGLRGAAVDPNTGTITLASIGSHLQKSVPGLLLQSSPAQSTLAHTRPLGGAWDPRLSTAPFVPTPGADPSDPTSLVGTVLPGQFRIDKQIARGGFGTVYQANQISVGRDVAVKVLDATVDPSSDMGRLFVHEIKNLARLRHDNVVVVYQADVTAGRLFFAMELLPGRDLQQVIDAEGPMPAPRAIALVQQLLAALAAAHAAGLVHADVKPANAILDGERLVLVDFGLSRLRAGASRDSASTIEVAGGTPAYMAPEQLRDGRVDARSDLFAAGLVLVALLTGWRRKSATELAPPLDGISDPALRGVLQKALAIAPDERYQSARDLSHALGGRPSPMQTSPLARPPFRHLAPFTEADRDQLRGRDKDIATLVEHVLYRRSVIYTAPSGTGKTSLLRAGLVARLDALGLRALYLACRSNVSLDLAASIWPGATGVVDAVARWHAAHHRRLVIVIDQLDAVLTGPGAPGLFADLIALDRAPAELDVGIVLSIREDYLAGLFAIDAGTEGAFAQFPVIRLGPLRAHAAREAIVAPLVERRIAIDEELLVALLADLKAAAARMAAELRWLDADADAVYPPHLQLACSVLYDTLPPDETTLTLAHYRRLGGLDAIVGEYLDRVLDSELPPASTAVARQLLVALVNPNQTRAFRTDRELAEAVADTDDALVQSVLEALRGRGLVVRLRAAGGDVGWELVHDSLVPRVAQWLDRGDLARRRAAELVRHHLRRSTPGHPSLLGRRELAELRGHESVLSQLDREWADRGSVAPSQLVARSHRSRRGQLGALVIVGAIVLAIIAVIAVLYLRERERRLANVGVVQLDLQPYDWDATAHVPTFGAAQPNLAWKLYGVDSNGELDERALLASSETSDPDGPGVWRATVPGANAILLVSNRGRGAESCAPAQVPLHRLPGYTGHDASPPTMKVKFPSCAATQQNLVEIPRGLFISGGLGRPAPPPEQAGPLNVLYPTLVDEPAYAIGLTEVTNAEFRVFADATGFPMTTYPLTDQLDTASGPDYPVSVIDWPTARAYCRFMGGDLPTARQWQKAMRGGVRLADGSPNPIPDRNVPWRDLDSEFAAHVPLGKPTRVGTTPDDKSPYGIYDLAGNVAEWTRSLPIDPDTYEPQPDLRVLRGLGWSIYTPDTWKLALAIENMRMPRIVDYSYGFRCVVDGQ